MLAIELLKVADRFSRVVIAKPPEPVRPLANGQLLFGGSLLLGSQTAGLPYPVKRLLGLYQQVPTQVFVPLANPGRKRAIYPAARREPGQRQWLGSPLEGIAKCGHLDPRVA